MHFLDPAMAGITDTFFNLFWVSSHFCEVKYKNDNKNINKRDKIAEEISLVLKGIRISKLDTHLT